VPERREALTGSELGAAGALERWFASAPWGLAVFDRRHRFTRVNAALAEMDGVAADEHLGRSLDDVLPALAGQVEPLLLRALERGETVDAVEIVGRTRADPDQDRIWIAACFPMRGDDGTVQAAAAMLLRLPDSNAVELDFRVREQRMRLAMEGTGTGFWEWDIATDRIRWSDSLGPLHGLARGETPAGYAAFLDLVHPEDRAGLEEDIAAAVRSGGDHSREFRVLQRDGTDRWMASRGHVMVDDSGRPAVAIGLMADVTERRRREDALTFLAEAGHALAGSLDPVATLDEIARLAVPRLADWCAVQLASDPSGGYENVAVAHVDPEKVRWALELQERYPPDLDAPTGVPQVIRTGRSELYPEIDEELLQAGAHDEEHLEIIQQLQMSSAMVVPLRARERTLGAITFIFAESGRQYSTHELELAEELGRRAGLALDHARLYEREHRTAETLQRALLPPTLPAIDGHELAARYLPGRRGDHVGGDWYDAFLLADGRVGIAIGDIGGRGVTAAALMGQVRNGLRAYALKAPGPGAALADLRQMGELIEELVFATLTYIVYDPRTGTGVLSSAGHLPTLVLEADGRTRFTDAPRCPPLGADPDCASPDHEFVLAPGATLVLYTDGLVESRTRSIDTGLQRLADAARASAGGVQRLADDIVEAVPEQRQDDIAVLALRRAG
jgi:PAS domain S-box-containing protein